jgi:hypothetical protein
MIEQYELQELVDFTADDLQANRRGRLSPRQVARFERATEDAQQFAVVFLVVGPLIVIAGATLAFWLQSWFTFLIILFGLGVVGIPALNSLIDPPSPPMRVLSRTGTASFATYGDETGDFHVLELAEYRFDIDERLYTRLRAAAPCMYTAYFTSYRNNHKLLALERAEAPDADR